MVDTRTALLDAGVRLYGSSAADLLKGLSAGAVAEEAGFHRQTFYRYWDTQAEYVQELQRHVLATVDAPVADGVTVLADRRGPVEDLDGFARELARHDFVRILEDDRIWARVGLIVMQALDTPALSDAAKAFHDATMDRLADGYEDLLDAFGRRAVAGTTPRDLARILQALVLGLVLQAKFADDDPDASELLERATRALLLGLTEPAEARASKAG
jgi:AcrR family transcriptional regulator